MTLRLGLCLALSVALSACGKSPEQAPSGASLQLTECPGLASTGSPPLVSGAQCGHLSVAENPERPEDGSIDLNILRLPAVAAEAKADPLFIIVGGPGQAAVGLADYLMNLLGAVRRSRDLVFIDQRGTGESQPLECPELPEFNPGLDVIHQQQEYFQAIEHCAEDLGERVVYYTTPYAVEDLERVRLALGYSSINLWGASYGTRVALAYMQQYPEQVRSATLDGLAPPAITLPWHVGRDSNRALRLLDQHCQEHPSCAQNYGSVWDKAQQTATRLGSHSAQLTLDHPRTGAPQEVTLTDEAFAGVIRMALYSRELSQLLPSAIAAAADGDFRAIAALWLLSESQMAQSGVSLGMHYTVLCNEDFPPLKERQPEHAEAFLGLNAVQTMAEICAHWPTQPLPEAYLQPVVSSTPVLLLSGNLDPITPPEWAEMVGQSLSNARHFTVPGGHHGVTQEGCVRRLVHRFLDDAAPEGLDGSCIEDIVPRPAMVHPTGRTTQPAKEDPARD